jgi:hypothetical protein
MDVATKILHETKLQHQKDMNLINIRYIMEVKSFKKNASNISI